MRDRKLLFRNLEKQEEVAAPITFQPDERPTLIYRDLGLVLLQRPDGRVAVRRIGGK